MSKLTSHNLWNFIIQISTSALTTANVWMVQLALMVSTSLHADVLLDGRGSFVKSVSLINILLAFYQGLELSFVYGALICSSAIPKFYWKTLKSNIVDFKNNLMDHYIIFIWKDNQIRWSDIHHLSMKKIALPFWYLMLINLKNNLAHSKSLFMHISTNALTTPNVLMVQRALMVSTKSHVNALLDWQGSLITIWLRIMFSYSYSKLTKIC